MVSTSARVIGFAAVVPNQEVELEDPGAGVAPVEVEDPGAAAAPGELECPKTLDTMLLKMPMVYLLIAVHQCGIEIEHGPRWSR